MLLALAKRMRQKWWYATSKSKLQKTCMLLFIVSLLCHCYGNMPGIAYWMVTGIWIRVKSSKSPQLGQVHIANSQPNPDMQRSPDKINRIAKVTQIHCVKKKQTPNGVTFAKSHQDLTPDLTAVSASPSSGILNQPVWNFLISTNEVICMIRSPAFS